MLKPLTLQPEAFGIDISDLSLKIIQLKHQGKFLGLSSFGKIPIKPGIIHGGEIKEQKALIEIIKKSLAQVKGTKLNTKYVIGSLPEEKAFLQVIQMPKMKEDELNKAVQFEAENYIPLPIDEVYFDSQIVGQPAIKSTTSKKQDHLDVLIAALPKKTVDPYVSSFKKAGLIPLAMEIESQAVSRALVSGYSTSTQVLLIDLGATRTSFIIFSGGSLRFTTSILVSSQRITEAIAKNLNIDFFEAENLKIKYGLKGNTKESIQVLKATEIPLKDLIDQIKRYLSYYRSHTSHEHLVSQRKEINKIYLCGGGANLKGLTDFISLQLKVPTELGNPWANILPKPLKEVPELPYRESLKYTTALGLALRGIKHT